MYLSIANDDPHEAGGRRKTQKHPRNVHNGTAPHPGDHHDANQGSNDTGYFSHIQRLMKHNWSDKDDDYRSHIVAQAGYRYGGVHIGREQEYPVQPKANPGGGEPDQVFTDRRQVYALMLRTKVQEDKP